jgi:hypothetical protein
MSKFFKFNDIYIYLGNETKTYLDTYLIIFLNFKKNIYLIEKILYTDLNNSKIN